MPGYATAGPSTVSQTSTPRCAIPRSRPRCEPSTIAATACTRAMAAIARWATRSTSPCSIEASELLAVDAQRLDRRAAVGANREIGGQRTRSLAHQFLEIARARLRHIELDAAVAIVELARCKAGRSARVPGDDQLAIRRRRISGLPTGKEAHARLGRLRQHAERTVDDVVVVDRRRALPIPVHLGADVVAA